MYIQIIGVAIKLAHQGLTAKGPANNQYKAKSSIKTDPPDIKYRIIEIKFNLPIII